MALHVAGSSCVNTAVELVVCDFLLSFVTDKNHPLMFIWLLSDAKRFMTMNGSWNRSILSISHAKYVNNK